MNAWIPRSWTRGMYFMDDYDPRFGEAFYDGVWMAGIDQEAMLRQTACPVVYLNASTNYGEDGVLYAATTDDDAARVRDCLAKCEYAEIDSGHDIHVEHSDDFIGAVARVIDTPIARASGENRANFAQALAQVSEGKQLILTFTPDEYSESIASVFDPIAATHLRLVLDDDERVVSVKGV